MSEGTAVIRRCVSCRKPITKQDYFINDDGPYCPDCIEAWACAGDQGAANLPPACSGNKPLRWRSGYLPDDFSGEVIIEMYDGTHRIYDLGERERFGMKRMAYKWLPLSEILDLIGGE